MLGQYLSFTWDSSAVRNGEAGQALEITRGMKDGEAFLGDNIETLGELFKDEDADRMRILVYGSYRDAKGFSRRTSG